MESARQEVNDQEGIAAAIKEAEKMLRTTKTVHEFSALFKRSRGLEALSLPQKSLLSWISRQQIDVMLFRAAPTGARALVNLYALIETATPQQRIRGQVVEHRTAKARSSATSPGEARKTRKCRGL